ncbi:L-ornithine N5-oxygenase [Apiospora arundinis]
MGTLGILRDAGALFAPVAAFMNLVLDDTMSQICGHVSANTGADGGATPDKPRAMVPIFLVDETTKYRGRRRSLFRRPPSGLGSGVAMARLHVAKIKLVI